MRNSIDGLSAKVQGLMGKNPFTGDLFVFSNRYHNMIKVLYWHTNGFCLWMKRLEKGRFKCQNQQQICSRPFTLGRRNWLFNDTADVAEASAIMFSVIRTAIANNLDPYWYLRYLPDNLLNLKTKEDFSAFMPQNVTKEQLISYKEQILAYENSLLARI